MLWQLLGMEAAPEPSWWRRAYVEAFNFVSKSDAPAGTELADAVVSPLGRMLLGKRTLIDQSVVQAKLRRGPDGREWGRGLIVLPHE